MDHTPLPWKLGPTGDTVDDANGLELLRMYENDGKCTPTPLPYRANAELIVKAVNAHEELVAVLNAVIQFGSLGCVERGSFYPPGGKKPATQDVWQFPRHLLTDIEAALAKAER